MHDLNDAVRPDETPLVIEWAPFRLAPDATEEALLQASEALQREFLNDCPGFLRRELLRGTDGQWADLVYWADEGSARSAAKVVSESAACLHYFSLMLPGESDNPEGGMLHLHRVRGYASAQREPAAR